MVTGVETAGLVLGAIPLILAGLQFYVEGIDCTKRYWKYKEAVKDLIRDLRRQETLYHNTINLLLIGVVGQKDIQPFLADPGGQLWKQEKVEKKLKVRLGASYTSYFETITQLLQVSNSFKQKLKLSSDGKPQFQDRNAFKEHYKRLRFSISKSDYKELMDRLAHLNETLYCMTNQTAQIAAHEGPSASKFMSLPNFRVVKEQAESFYSALSRGWKCPCQADHSVSLRLEPRMDSGDDDDDETEETMRDPFHVLFRYDHHHPPVQCATKPWTWEEADVRIEQKPITMPNQVDKGVRFAKQQIPKAVQAAFDTSPNLQPIKDLCAAISAFQSPQRDVCFQLLEDEIAKQQCGILITPTKQLPADASLWSVSSLQANLQNPKFSQKDRFKLAVILASSVLQLHETPWLEEKWRADSIFFVDRSGMPCYDQPFVSQYFGQLNAPTAAEIPTHFSCIIGNQTLYALGVALIELWYRKPIEELWVAADGPQNTGNNLLDLMTEFKTAERLSDALYSEAGAKYSDAVRRCIRCEFDKRARSLEDAQFQKAVYQMVVAQLQEHYDYLFDLNPT